MNNLFEITARDGSKIVVHARNGVFQVWATSGRGSQYFHVMSKKTERGAIGYAKRMAAN